ncbi:MAG: hypothetical protein AUJ01_11910 [Acidobacteria bacterium 13_1_40CM_3_65_5]|nr:MAG: hypothetical protein AUJ01_11910 [Acidobacteria bacterium 13_1_40CM_3_65_5]
MMTLRSWEIFVLRVLGRRVLEDEDRAVAHHFVRQLVHRHDLVERLLERDAVQLNGDRPILHLAVVRDVDAGLAADEREHVFQAGVGEAQAGQHFVRVDEGRRRRRGARALAHLLDGRRRTRRFDALADGAIERRDLRGRQPIARVVLARGTIFAERGLELILLLELARLLEVRARRRLHRALERDSVIRIVGRGLCGAAVRSHGFVQIARARGVLALPEGLPRGAASHDQRQCEHHAELLQPCRHNLQSAINLKSAI